MAIPATQIRRGMVILFEGQLCKVVEFRHHTPGNLRAMVQTKLRNIRTGSSFEHRFRSADTIEPEWLAAPVLFVTALIYDRTSSQRAFEIVGTPNPDLLELAGIKGVAHPALRRMAYFRPVSRPAPKDCAARKM